MYHVPVLLKKSVEGLALKEGGIYVDLTFGGGGHTKEILSQMNSGKLYSFDQDDDAKANAAIIEDEKFTFVQANFCHFKRFLRLHGISKVDGILADLGISSHQIDCGERGFSTRFDATLDMRMNQKQDLSAKEVVNEYKEAELKKVLGLYGEVRNATTLSKAIVSARANREIVTTKDLIEVCRPLAKRGKENRYFAQVFQALRIEVNDEIRVLEEMLEQTAEVLNIGGRLSVISYHSLEDRLVKNFINKGKFSGEVEKDFYGNDLKPYKAISRKPIAPSDEEIAENPRARSAKLRVAEKIEVIRKDGK